MPTRADSATAIMTKRALLLLGLLVAAMLRLGKLGRWSLWYDETVSVFLAQLPLREMIDHTAGDIHPPGYYALLHFWQRLLHPAPTTGMEFIYGWVSVASGLLLLTLLYVVARHFFDETSALLALWLGALNPFQIWYSQEVRMYTLGALLALLCFWATVRWLRGGGWGWLALYAVVAAAGIYTLYYFLFALAGIGMATLLLARSWRKWLLWLGANGVAALLFVPWWGVFWRQATDPPVPPWRVPWENAADIFASAQEALAAPLVGQAAAGPLWLWALLAAGVTLWALLMIPGDRWTRLALGAFMLVPILALFGATLLVAPLYHVRYLFLFAAPMLIFAGATVVDLWRRWKIAGGALLVLLTVGSLLSLWNGWTNPAFARDDHRGAVQRLMREWRPGDVVLVNAGWIYTPLAIYWDEGESAGWTAPPLGGMVRLLPKELEAWTPDASANLSIVRTGIVDGDPALGWGAADSDFFAASAEETVRALDALIANPAVGRIWHYRMYDTVSDPEGVIRAWLNDHTTLQRDDVIPGRDFGRLELRAVHGGLERLADAPIATFDGAIDLYAIDTARTDSPAGTTLYATLHLDPTEAELPPLAASLRLLDSGGNQVAQHDEAIASTVAPLAISVGDVPAGEYTLTVLLYDPATGAAFPVETGWESIGGQQLVIGRYPIE